MLVVCCNLWNLDKSFITAVDSDYTEHFLTDFLYDDNKRNVTGYMDLFPLIPLSVTLSEILMMSTKQWMRLMNKLRA